MSRLDRVGTHETSVMHTYDNRFTLVEYHETIVVNIDHKCKTVTLRDGGYRTAKARQSATTKRRMNQVSNEFNLGYRVYKKGSKWFVEHGGEVVPFMDGMTLKLVEKKTDENTKL